MAENGTYQKGIETQGINAWLTKNKKNGESFYFRYSRSVGILTSPPGRIGMV